VPTTPKGEKLGLKVQALINKGKVQRFIDNKII
jgi:hypothetical protein